MEETRDRLSARLTAEERMLLRKLGTALTSILQGTLAPVPETSRRDELGILCAIANRMGHEILAARKRDAASRSTLEAKLQELEQSYAIQENLLRTIRELSAPLLLVHPCVLLLPLIGHISEDRSHDILVALLHEVVRQRARVVILDVTSAVSGDEMTAAMIDRATRAVRLLGAELVLSGVSADFAKVAVQRQIDLHGTRSYPALSMAVGAARQLVKTRGEV